MSSILIVYHCKRDKAHGSIISKMFCSVATVIGCLVPPKFCTYRYVDKRLTPDSRCPHLTTSFDIAILVDVKDWFLGFSVYIHKVLCEPFNRFREGNIPSVITTDNSFQYGPVCLDMAYRSRGLLNRLFETMRLEWAKKYPLSVTFINQVNERSTQAHIRKLGWEIIDRFTFNGNKYYGLIFEMSKSVLNN